MAIPSGDPLGTGKAASWRPLEGLSSPIVFDPGSVYQRFPPGPEAMLSPAAAGSTGPVVVRANPLLVPSIASDGPSLPIRFAPLIVNHRFPSEPTVIPFS